jgi:hypothetical protein
VDVEVRALLEQDPDNLLMSFRRSPLQCDTGSFISVDINTLLEQQPDRFLVPLTCCIAYGPAKRYLVEPYHILLIIQHLTR